jgi:hypothetical protein
MAAKACVRLLHESIFIHGFDRPIGAGLGARASSSAGAVDLTKPSSSNSTPQYSLSLSAYRQDAWLGEAPQLALWDPGFWELGQRRKGPISSEHDDPQAAEAKKHVEGVTYFIPIKDKLGKVLDGPAAGGRKPGGVRDTVTDSVLERQLKEKEFEQSLRYLSVVDVAALERWAGEGEGEVEVEGHDLASLAQAQAATGAETDATIKARAKAEAEAEARAKALANRGHRVADTRGSWRDWVQRLLRLGAGLDLRAGAGTGFDVGAGVEGGAAGSAVAAGDGIGIAGGTGQAQNSLSPSVLAAVVAAAGLYDVPGASFVYRRDSTNQGARAGAGGASSAPGNSESTAPGLSDTRTSSSARISIIDSAPQKQGRYSPVSHRIIVPPDQLLQGGVAAILVIAPNYSEEIYRTIRERYGLRCAVGLVRAGALEVRQ